MIRLMIVDDHPVVRAGLRALFDTVDDVEVIGEAGSCGEAIEQAQALQPTVVLCDLKMGADREGIETTRLLRELDPAPVVLILTSFDHDADILASIEAGAAGYLLKESAPSEIVAAVHASAKGELVLSQDFAMRAMTTRASAADGLTKRETTVLQLLATGASNKEMARQLVVSEATIKSHLAHIFEKLGVDSRLRAISVARDKGLL